MQHTVKVGDRVRREFTALTVKEDKRIINLAADGVVSYVHPKGRYYTVQFDCGVRESYHMNE